MDVHSNINVIQTPSETSMYSMETCVWCDEFLDFHKEFPGMSGLYYGNIVHLGSKSNG